MVELREQIAFSQDNLTALASLGNETFNDLDNFQPDEAHGQEIQIRMIQMSVRGAYYPIPVASENHVMSLEIQLSTAATFGQQRNILGALYLAFATRVGATTVGGEGPSQAQDNLVIGDMRSTIATIRVPGAVYLHTQLIHLFGSANLVAGEIKTAGQANIFYSRR